jgi:hypothetical protein
MYKWYEATMNVKVQYLLFYFYGKTHLEDHRRDEVNKIRRKEYRVC